MAIYQHLRDLIKWISWIKKPFPRLSLLLLRLCLNVHRWSLEEDVTLLKSVPLLGNQWAELSNRIIPHRDRGHLRKRYQVLERRIKATVTRSKRSEAAMLPRTTPILVSTQRPPVTKTTVLSRKRKGGPVKPPALPLNGSIIRGPGVPAHLLCPSNGKGGKNKPVRKTMDFAARRTSPTAKRPLPTNGKSKQMVQEDMHRNQVVL